MTKIILEEDINVNENFSSMRLFEIFEYFSVINHEIFKFIFFILISIVFIFITAIDIYYRKNILDLRPFNKYINDCKKFIKYGRNKIVNKYSYISVCIPVLNMENFIKKNILSIINQTFQDFQIIIVNDGSCDKTDYSSHAQSEKYFII